MPKAEKPFTVFVHGRQYYVRFFHDGRQLRKPVCPVGGVARGEAEAAAREVVQTAVGQLDRARNDRHSQHPLTQYDRRIRNRSVSHRENCARFKARFLSYFHEQDMLTISKSDVEGWRDWLAGPHCQRDDRRKGPLSNKTVKEHIDWLAAVYNNAGLHNPTVGVERPSATHAARVEALEFFTPGEMVRLFDVAAAQHPHYYNGFVVLAYTGCRVAEVQGLRPEDLDQVNHAIWVTGKGSKRRPLQLTGPAAPAWEALMDEIRTKPKEHGFIFAQAPSWGQKMMTAICNSAFGVIEEDAPVKAGARKKPGPVKKIRRPVRHGHPHMLRHTLATMALLHFDPPWDIVHLSKWLGHADIGTTFRIYGHMILKEVPSSYSSTKVAQAKKASHE